MTPVGFTRDSRVKRGGPQTKRASTTVTKKAAANRAIIARDTPSVMIDDRAGSQDLIKHAPLDSCGELCRLDSADVMFAGNGESRAVLVGVEVKSIFDLIASINTGRLQATQIPAMLNTYDESWILHYGLYRAGAGGELEVHRKGSWEGWSIGNRAVPYGYIESMLLTVAMLGVKIKRVGTLEEAAQWIACLARWWNKPWAEHKGMRTFDTSASARAQSLLVQLDRHTRVRVEMFAAIPGVGYERALALMRHFGSVTEAVLASDKELMQVAGVGKGIAKAIRAAVE